jgi:hypothetical protein
VDKYLAERGRLIMIETEQDVESKIRLVKRPRGAAASFGEGSALKQIVAAIGEVIECGNVS